MDYPEGDRTFVQLLRRFSTIDARSVEQPVNPDDADDMGYWPFLMVGLAGYWELSDTQIPNMNSLMGGGGGWLEDGSEPHWRGVIDEHGRR